MRKGLTVGHGLGVHGLAKAASFLAYQWRAHAPQLFILVVALGETIARGRTIQL